MTDAQQTSTASNRKPLDDDLIDVEEMKDRIIYLEDRIEELEALLGLRAQFHFPFEIKLSRTRERLIGMLMSLPEVSSESAFAALYGTREHPPTFNVLSVHITHVRKILARIGITIHTIHGFGWSLSAADRAKLKEYAR